MARASFLVQRLRTMAVRDCNSSSSRKRSIAVGSKWPVLTPTCYRFADCGKVPAIGRALSSLHQPAQQRRQRCPGNQLVWPQRHSDSSSVSRFARLGGARSVSQHDNRLCDEKQQSARPGPVSPSSPSGARWSAAGPLETQTKTPRGRRMMLAKHEDIYTLPNILTATRLVAAPAVGYLILSSQAGYALGLFIYAGVTDLVDGYLARRYKQQTVVGSVIDPMADKSLMAIVVVCLAIKGGLPLWLATLILGRDVSLAVAAIYYRYASLPAPKTFARYWDFSLPSAEVHPTGVSKFNTFLQLVLIGAALTLPVLSNDLLAQLGLHDQQFQTVFENLGYLVACTTIWSGASYVWHTDVVNILGTDDALKRKQGFRGRVILAICFATCLSLAARFAVTPEKGEANEEASKTKD